MKFGIVGRTADVFFRYQAWPTVAKDEKGVLYAASSGHRLGHVCPFGKDFLYISHDEGDSWLGPIIANDTYLDDRDVGILYLGGKKLLVTWFCHPAEAYEKQYGAGMRQNWCGSAGLLDAYPTIPAEFAAGGSFIRISEDGGYTWGETIKVPVSSPHGPSLLKNGDLVYLGKAMYTDKEENGAVAAYGSSDGGKTWKRLGGVAIPEGLIPDHFHEPHMIELENGRLLGMIRAQGPGVFHGFTIYQTVSDDGGRTWTTPVPLNVTGSPPHLLKHSSGAIICAFGRREQPFGERAIVSWDNGETWEDEYILHETTPCDLGYPASVELPNGEILTVYYQAVEGDGFTSIQYTKWSLEKK